MPKDEFDVEDPFELNGMAFLTHEDTTGTMAECFVEEFLRMGYNSRQVLALFQNPHYVGPNLAMESRGEPFVRTLIAEIFARWGKPVVWPAPCHRGPEEVQTAAPTTGEPEQDGPVDSVARVDGDGNLTDPLGAPIPKLNL